MALPTLAGAAELGEGGFDREGGLPFLDVSVVGAATVVFWMDPGLFIVAFLSSLLVFTC